MSFALNPNASTNGTRAAGDDLWHLWAQIVYYATVSIAVVGACANAVVLVWLTRFRRRQPKLKPASALFYMCVADIVCLLCLLGYTLGGELLMNADWVAPIVKLTFCKTSIFVIHTASAFSVWCWMMLSCVRFCAVFAPVVYVQLERSHSPASIMRLMLLVCATVELWLLAVTTYDAGRCECVADSTVPLKMLRMGATGEVVANFVLPSLLTIIMDATLLLLRPPSSRRLIDRQSQSSSQSRGSQLVPLRRQATHYQRRMMAFRRYLFLNNVDLLLNSVHAAVRLSFVHDVWPAGTAAGGVISGVGAVLWYSQFSINLMYVWVLSHPSHRRRTVLRPGGGGVLRWSRSDVDGVGHSMCSAYSDPHLVSQAHPESTTDNGAQQTTSAEAWLTVPHIGQTRRKPTTTSYVEHDAFIAEIHQSQPATEQRVSSL